MHVLPSKATSVDKFAAERIVEDIVYLGRTRVILRRDNEPALVALVGDVLKGLRTSNLTRLLQRALCHATLRRPERQRCL